MAAVVLLVLLAQLDLDAWEKDMARLSDDAMEGRAPGAPGGDAAAAYIAGRFESLHLERGGDEGYLQQIPLAGGATAANVVGLLRGADGEAGALVVTAHYDAYGIGEADDRGDVIYNGALDNAAGVAGLIELARHFASRKTPLPRTLVFIATTAEETGSAGLKLYAEHPAVPLEQTVVNLNVDGINVFAATEDFIVFPSEGTETRADLERIGASAGMTLRSEPWQAGMHFAFDTRVFLERGIVGLTLWHGSRYRGVSEDEARERRGRFGRIHTPADEWPGWFDADAVEQHLRLYIAAIEHYAGDAAQPRFSEPNPFRPR